MWLIFKCRGAGKIFKRVLSANLHIVYLCIWFLMSFKLRRQSCLRRAYFEEQKVKVKVCTHKKDRDLHINTHTCKEMVNAKKCWTGDGMHSTAKDAWIIKPRAHTHSPLPGHFALERAEKLMRVQSFITLETEWGSQNRGERERKTGREREWEREGLYRKRMERWWIDRGRGTGQIKRGVTGWQKENDEEVETVEREERKSETMKKEMQQERREGNPVSSLCCGCHGNPHLTVGTDFWVSQSARILSRLEHN